MAAATRETILNGVWTKRKPVPVDVPELGTLHVRVLTQAEKDAFDESTRKVVNGELVPNLANVTARVVALCACDEKGKRLFTDDDAQSLGDLPCDLLAPVFEAAQRVNLLSGQAREDARKNSAPTPASASG